MRKQLTEEQPPRHGYYLVWKSDGSRWLGRWHHGHFHAASERELLTRGMPTESEMADVAEWDFIEDSRHFDTMHQWRWHATGAGMGWICDRCEKYVPLKAGKPCDPKE